MVSVTTVLGLVSADARWKLFCAKLDLNESASLLVRRLYSAVNCRINSNPFALCTSAFTCKSEVTRFTPSEYAFIRVDVRAWLLKALLRMAMRRLLRALCTFVSPFHARTEGHLHACSISAPNSKEACIAQAVKSPT